MFENNFEQQLLHIIAVCIVLIVCKHTNNDCHILKLDKYRYNKDYAIVVLELLRVLQVNCLITPF